ncbi:GIY-YIG nuclease family protein [uncultured Nevskia sp.]|uniref:GIY-YIG nuclease family protein n=1 Tax=uncultured Nevskia sp. TaxID=228950 RepID=UPI0025DE9112|nr:GIY-YIG nuclease family protein [uncultured Nevskia sp.]
MKQRQFFVYMLASQKNGTLYIGVTSDLVQRVWQHKNDLVEGFIKKYAVHDLVWFESRLTAMTAITREKQIKKWNRSWKIELIDVENPDWNDLFGGISV